MGKASHRKNKSIILLGASLITFGCVLAVTSLAWFCPPQSNANVTGMTGKATGSYFESGDGSSTAPYVIANAKQLYYFNWLQDLGYFNKDNDNDGTIDTVYFKIKDGLTEINAENYVLPPAGTSSNPFVGNFDGNGCVIKNLTISNSWEDLQSTKPAAAKQNGNILQSAEIVGFFGIVGEYETDIAYSTSTNAIKDLYFDNLTVESASSNVLAGFIAGYANGAIDNCGIHCGQFSFVSGAKALTGTKLKGESISRFTLIGDYDSSGTFNWENNPGDSSGSGSSGSGTEWGASINMETLTRRINYMVTSYTKNELNGTAKNYTESSRFNLYAKYNATTEFYWNEQSNTQPRYANLADGSLFPLTIDTSKAFVSDGELNKEITITFGSNTFHTTDAYVEATFKESDVVSSNNSGYFVGGGTLNNGSINNQAGGYLYIRRQTVVSAMANAGQSSNSVYVPSAATFKYIDTSGSEGSISLEKDSDGKVTATTPSFQKAVNVINQYNESENNKRWAHGLRFYGTNDFGTDTDSTRMKNQTAKMFGKTYSNYEFVKSGLNFTAKNRGYITTIVCTANTSTVMFQLYKIERNGCTATSDCSDEHSISSVTQIKQIYKYTDSSGKEAYEYNGNTHSGTLVFDFEKISMSTQNALYYFEIPIEAGDYVLGKNGPAGSSSSSNSAFVTYLDIGSSGNENPDQPGDTSINSTNIDFVYKESGVLAKITDEGYTPSGVVFSIGGPSTSAGLIYFKRESKENKDGETVVVGVAYYTATGCSITPSGNGKSTNKEPDPDQ